MEERCGWPEAPPKILEDRIPTILINLLDGPPKSPYEITDGLIFSFEDGL